MNFDDVVNERRSVRHFIERSVEREKVEAILRCAALSPSAKNRQPWYFSVLQGEAREGFGRLLRERAHSLGEVMVAQTAQIILNADVLILVLSGKEVSAPTHSDILSVGGAMYSMCLKATDLGLGSLIIADTDIIAEEIARSLDNGALYGAVAIGYPARHYPSRPRKSFGEITDFGNEERAERVHDEIEKLDLAGAQYAFCSYSHKNSDTVISDMIELQRHNIPIWYDKLLPVGGKWDENALEVLRAEDCRAVLLYLSPESVASEPVMREFVAAIDRQRQDPDFLIIPIHVGGALLTDIVRDAQREYGTEYGEIYLDYFGRDNRVIFIGRDVYPSSHKHLTTVIDALTGAGVVTNGRVYDSFLYRIEGGEYAVITKYNGFSERVVPPSAICGYPVRRIGKNAFTGNCFMKECVLPDTVIAVDEGAFLNCRSLVYVEIPRQVSELGVACFRDCHSLQGIALPTGLTVLREALFRDCQTLCEITVPEGVEELEEAVFLGCSSLKRAVMPSSLKRVTDGGFIGCSALEELVIPSEVEGFEAFSFSASKNLSRTVVSGFVFEHGEAYPV